MHTLSLFPSLFTFGLVAPALLRVTVGIVGIIVGLAVFKKSEKSINKLSSLVYLITSVSLILGLYTQIFSIIGILAVILNNRINDRGEKVSSEKKIIYVLAIAILISLLFTGPGFLAIDLPL